MKIMPNDERILITKIEKEGQKTGAGVYVPGQALAEEALHYGEIVEVPKDCKFKKNDRVYYSRYSSTMIDSTKKLFIVSVHDIMAYEA